MRILLGAALAASLALGAGPAAAALLLDQSSVSGDGVTMTSLGALGFLSGSPGRYGFGQSFTVGRTGRLDAISFGLVNWAATPLPMRLSLYAPNPANLDVNRFYTMEFWAPQFYLGYGAFTPWSSLPTIDLRSANLQVQAGHSITFVLTTGLPTNSLALVESINGQHFDYARGAKQSIINGQVRPLGAGDFVFRTFVSDPNAAVPEPQIWALLVGGFAAVGAGLRRRRRLAGA